MEPLSFYHEIEGKVCGDCGHQFQEQCECYLTICEKCMNLQAEQK